MNEEAAGVRTKPDDCATCMYARVGKGFCPDYVPRSPRIAIWAEAPGQNEILYQEPLVGKAGWFFENALLRPHGYSKRDVIIANTLRCNPPGNKYPTGKTRRAAEELCRQYDTVHGRDMVPGGIVAWKPDMVILTMHSAALLRSAAPYRAILEHVRKAFEFAKAGRRPILAMGDKAMGVLCPHLDGGIKRWAGHWEEFNYEERFRREF